jgi:hypothetical protein
MSTKDNNNNEGWNSRFAVDKKSVPVRVLPPKKKEYIALNGAEVKSTIRTGSVLSSDKKKVSTNSHKKSSKSINKPPETNRYLQGILRGVEVDIKDQNIPPRPSSSLPHLLDIKATDEILRSSTGNNKTKTSKKLPLESSLSLEIDISNITKDKPESRIVTEYEDIMDHSKIDGLNHIVRFCTIGKGSSSQVYKSVIFPSLQIVADKVVIISNPDKRIQVVRELQSLRSVLDEGYETTTNAVVKRLPPRSNINRLPSSSAYNSNNIVRLLEVYSNPRDGTVSVCLEYMDGGSLQDALCAGPVKKETVLAGISRQILNGLSFLHSRRHVHRDIKPGNILLCSGYPGTPISAGSGTDAALGTPTPVVKISDFGLSRELEKGHSLADSFLGTFHYMSP